MAGLGGKRTLAAAVLTAKRKPRPAVSLAEIGDDRECSVGLRAEAELKATNVRFIYFHCV